MMDANSRDELHQLFTAAWTSSTRTASRNAFLIVGIRDAIQAHRPWATVVRAQAESTGLAAMLKAWAKAEQLTVTGRNGKQFDKPRIVGALESDDDGSDHWTQIELDGMTLPQLRDKRKRDLTQIRSYRNSVAIVDKLIALCEAAEEATPRGAAKKLGTTVEAWLAA